MNSFFKNLTRGVKFNTNRFLDDAVKLQVVKEVDSIVKFVPSINAKSGQGSGKKKRKAADLGEEDEEISIFQGKNQHEGDGKVPEKKKLKKSKSESSRQKEEDLERTKRIRKSNSIFISGFDIPPPVEEFVSIPRITEQMLTNIKMCGYEVPTPVQMQAIPIMLEGRELLASAPTGSGKSAAFLIPILLMLEEQNNTGAGVRAVIVSPTRELAGQIYRECRRLSEGLRLKTCNLAKKDSGKGNAQKTNKCDILITTPNRLVYSIKDKTISMESVQHLIVDECDNLFEKGFQEQLGFIYSACNSANIKRAFFSATCAHGVEQFCRAHLDNHIVLSIGARNSAIDLVEQSVVFVGTEAGKLIALRTLVAKGILLPALIFVQSQSRADELYAELLHDGLNCSTIHSGKSEAQREQIIEQFRLGKIWILICTALMSRGMDFPFVKTVINYDMPASHVQYIHAIGRTGRAGRIGRAITYFTEEDRGNLRRIAQILKNSGFPIPSYMLKMKKPRKDEVRVPKRKHISRRAKLAVHQQNKFKHKDKREGKKSPEKSDSDKKSKRK